MIDWVWHVFDHLRLKEKHPIHFVFYEALLINFQHELDRLLNYLKLHLDEEEKKDLEQEVSFSNLKKTNPKHLKKGAFGYWKNHFDPEQQEKTALITRPLLNILDYTSLERTGSFNPPQTFNTIDFEGLKQELITAQNQL